MSTGSGSASEETTKKPRLNQGDIKVDALAVDQGQTKEISSDLSAEMPMSIDRYNVTEVLGSGAYGSVYLVTDTLNGGTFAMKQIPLDGKDIQGCHTREFSPLQEIDHPNIVKLERVFVEQQYIYVVMEYLRWDLKTFVEEHANMFEVPMTLKSFTKQLLSAVHFCHMNEFIHRDLKPENILIKMQEEGIIVKLADFGQSRGWIHGGANLTPEINMLSYRAPEMILGSRTYTSAVDMWGVGCVLAFILQLDAPFPGETSYAVLAGIFSWLGTPPANSTQDLWGGKSLEDRFSDMPKYSAKELGDVIDYFGDEDLLDLIKGLLVLDPADRMSASEALKHPYLVDLDI